MDDTSNIPVENIPRILGKEETQRLLAKRTGGPTPEELTAILKKDAFLQLWKNNYYKNFEKGLLANERTRPLMFLVNTSALVGIPIVLVAAGPSIDKNLHFLKEYQDKCIIICADVTLFKLIQYNIKPDFVVNIDPHESIMRFWDFLDTSNLILVCPTTSNPKALEAWKGRFFFFNQSDVANSPKGEELKRLTKPTSGWGYIFNRFFIGATMTQFAEVFRPKPLILIGYDFGFTDGKAYCEGLLDIKLHHDEDPVGSEKHTKVIAKLKELEVKKEVEILISKNESVWTTNQLNLYRKTYTDYVKKLPFSVINATEGGILLDLPRAPLKEALEKYCINPIKKGDPFALPTRKRRKKR
jgi:hypothetical protein